MQLEEPVIAVALFSTASKEQNKHGEKDIFKGTGEQIPPDHLNVMAMVSSSPLLRDGAEQSILGRCSRQST